MAFKNKQPSADAFFADLEQGQSQTNKPSADAFFADSAPVSSSPKSLPEQSVNIAKKMVTAPMTNPISQRLESAGQKVKGVAQESLSNLARKPSQNIGLKTAVLGTASTLAEAAPFTPSEMAVAIGGEALPVLASNKVINNLSETVGNKFLNTPAKVLKKGIKGETDSLGRQLIDTPELSGSRDSVMNQARMKIEELEGGIRKAISSSKAGINKADLVGGLDELVGQLSKTGVNQREIKILESFKNRFLANQPNQIPIQIANEIKRQFYKNVGDASFFKDKDAILVAAQKAVASDIRKSIEKFIPNIKQLNAQQAKFIQIRDSLIDALPKEAKSIGSSLLGDFTDAATLGAARTAQKIPNIRGVGGITQSGSKRK